jgi:hypothetical protein
MKKIKFIFTIMIMCICISSASANSDYDKTFSIGVDPLGFILLGPSVVAEWSGLGAIGIYGEYQNIGSGSMTKTIEDEDKIKITGYGVRTGLKYYLNYDNSYHDSYYVAASYMFMHMDLEEQLIATNKADFDGHFGILSIGRRWQWSTIFLDLSGGVAYAKTKVKLTGNYNEQDAEDIEKALDGVGLDIKFTVGVAF